MMQSDIGVVQLLVQLCVDHGVKSVVITPGSRNAPLAISFHHHTQIDCYSIVDERSAGFFALGLSLAKNEPVALCCTSGTALLNYYPSVAEAFYQRCPLVVLSADRPPEKIDQQDGQTIRQAHVMDHHVRKSVNLVMDANDPNAHTHNSRLINEALLAASYPISGPVHINIPLREPLYHTVELEHPVSKAISMYSGTARLDETQWDQLLSVFEQSGKVMILLGMNTHDPKTKEALQTLDEWGQIAILQETTSNSRRSHDIHIDRLLGSISKDQFNEFSPDLLITAGGGVISKRLKQWLRAYPPQSHWHVNTGGEIVDTYQALSKVIDMDPGHFLIELSKRAQPIQSLYKIAWSEKEMVARYRHNEYLKDCPYSDLKVFSLIEEASKAYALDLHVGNSSAIRYVQLFDFPFVRYHHCNRGTSGIDGASSTAVGYAHETQFPTLLITGDISFFYDINAWWNQYISPQLKVILINNGGGNIFRLIDGPSQGGALDPYQETPHDLNAEDICRTFRVSYSFVDNEIALVSELDTFFESSSQPSLLEIRTPKLENPRIWKAYFKYLTHGNYT